MSPRRLWVGSLPEAGGEVRLDRGAAHHARVLRLGPGDSVELFDGKGLTAHGAVKLVQDSALVCEISAPFAAARNEPALVLVQVMPKGTKLESIVRMATELGVNAVHLAVSAHAVPRPDAGRATRGLARLERLRRIAREAARQCGRSDVPDVLPPVPLLDVAQQAPPGAVRVVLAPGATQPLATRNLRGASAVWLVVGAEGGLDTSELDALNSHGYVDASLGPHTLRVETASPVAVALVRAALLR